MNKKTKSPQVPLMAVKDLHKTYKIARKKPEVKVLRGASFEVYEGESVAIVGLSGAGKSTLLHILGALDEPERGKVILRGEDMYRLSARRRTWLRSTQIGFVFQSYHLLPEMDVLENVMLPSRSRTSIIRSVFETRKRALYLLQEVGLESRAEHTPLELSGGEQQRVALARALINDPEIILADEPTGNLDDDTGRHVLEHLFSLTGTSSHTLILVTHNKNVAAMCDRTLILEDGLILSENESE